jgi:hypothetical protein
MTLKLAWDSAIPKEEVVTLGATSYILREASGGAASEHKDATFKAVKVNNQTNTSTFAGIADADLVLLSRCLLEDKTPPDKPDPRVLSLVPLATLRGWPNRITEPLITHLKEISGMETPETKESLTKKLEEVTAKLAKPNGETAEGENADTAKNSPAGTTRS